MHEQVKIEVQMIRLNREAAFTVNVDRRFLASAAISGGFSRFLHRVFVDWSFGTEAIYEASTDLESRRKQISVRRLSSSDVEGISTGFLDQSMNIENFKKKKRTEIFSLKMPDPLSDDFVERALAWPGGGVAAALGGTLRVSGDRLLPRFVAAVRDKVGPSSMLVHADNRTGSGVLFVYYGDRACLRPQLLWFMKTFGLSAFEVPGLPRDAIRQVVEEFTPPPGATVSEHAAFLEAQRS